MAEVIYPHNSHLRCVSTQGLCRPIDCSTLRGLREGRNDLATLIACILGRETQCIHNLGCSFFDLGAQSFPPYRRSVTKELLCYLHGGLCGLYPLMWYARRNTALYFIDSLYIATTAGFLQGCLHLLPCTF